MAASDVAAAFSRGQSGPCGFAGFRFAFGTVKCLLPSVEHLMAMKLHALRFSGEQRTRTDGIDVIDLARGGVPSVPLATTRRRRSR